MSEELVGGRYRLAEVIGSGGMGRVWRAEDELLRRTVAVKEVTGPATALLAVQTMREARAAARLDHPGVVTVFDVVWQAGRSWIVMEYVEGRSLGEAIAADGPFPHAEAARIGLAVLEALRAVHTAGVLHRDVKPQNVLLARDGRILLSDFGVASTGDPDGTGEALVGSPLYVAPERLGGQRSTTATDLWSLGATLYASVEGTSPFARATTEASLLAVTTEEPSPAANIGELTPLILRLLAKDPAARPSASITAAMLRRASGQRPWQGRATVPRAVGRAGIRAALPSHHPISRTGRLAIVGAVTLLLGTGGAALAVGRAPSGAPRPAAETGTGPSTDPSTTVGTGSAAVPVGACGAGAESEPVVAATTRIPAGLPTGWVWTRDPAGFALALPRGWSRATAGNSVCFSDPQGAVAFAVNTSAVVTREPLAYWQGRERAELSRGMLPGYRRVSMGVLLLRRGGADWEYTWRSDSDTTQHVRRLLLAVTENRSYLLQWATTDTDWERTVTVQKQLVNFFGAAN